MEVMNVIALKLNGGDGSCWLRILAKFQVVWRAEECKLQEGIHEVILTCGAKESISCQMWLMIHVDMRII